MNDLLDARHQRRRPRIFIVAVFAGDDAYDSARRLVGEAGCESYADADEFFPDGVQDPYRAVDECDALIWIYQPANGSMVLGKCDYNLMYADTVMQRAVRARKPILHYQLQRERPLLEVPSPAVMQRIARRSRITSIAELEATLGRDLTDLVAGKVSFFDPNAPYVFLSYTHSDRIFARRLKQDLNLAGARLWIDEEEIRVGDSLIGRISSAIDEVEYFAVLLSPESVASRWVTHELDVAMNQQIAGRRIRVLPLLVSKVELPGFLKGKRYADFSEDYNLGLRELLVSLELELPYVPTRAR